MYFFKLFFMPVQVNLSPFLLFDHGSAFPFWPERLIRCEKLGCSQVIRSPRQNSIKCFFQPVSPWPGQTPEPQLPGSPCPLIISGLICTQFWHVFNCLHLAVFILVMGLSCSPCAHTSGWLPAWSPFLCCPSPGVSACLQV